MIEDQVRAIIVRMLNDIVCKGWAQRHEDEAAAALMRLVEPPETGVSLDAQIEWLEAVTENVPGLFDPVMQPIAQTKLGAALATLRWVQSRQEKKCLK